MKPERVGALMDRWVRLYTAGLPTSAARRRTEEIDADVADHIAHKRALGAADSRIAFEITSRMIRGAAADVTWRRHQTRTARSRSTQETTMKASTLASSALRVTIFVLAVLAIPLVGMALSEEVVWSVADFVLAGLLLGAIGVCFEAAVRRRGNVLIGAAVAGLGVVAAGVGELDDAPGLVLLGALLIAGGGAVAYRRIQGSPLN